MAQKNIFYYLEFEYQKKFSTLFLSLLLLSFMASCVQQPTGSGRRAQTASNSAANTSNPTSTGANSPSFSTSLNYFQMGSVAMSGPITLDVDFKDSIYLRGKEVHNFITKGNNASSAQCLISYFPNSLNRKIFVMVARPQVFYNFSTSSQEYFYQIFPSDKTGNSTFCQTSGVSSKISTLYGVAATTAFSLAEVCASCLPGVLDGLEVRLMEINGVEITNISVTSLKMKINMNITPTTSVGMSCTTTSECKNLGFDCCNTGVCVKDKQIKSDVDQSSSAYLQALSDITSNPASIFNYTQFYHLCTQTITPLPTPTPMPNPDLASNSRLELLAELYDCTTTTEGEASICTKNYENANTLPVDFLTGNDDRTFATTYTGTASLPTHGVTKIIHSGVTLFTAGDAASGSTYQINGVHPGGVFLPTVGVAPGAGITGTGNDTLTDPVRIFLNHPKPTSATNDTLKIKYKIDGSCRYITSTIAECKKYYVQGQNLGKTNDHFPASNEFLLPLYADITKNIRVEVDEANIPADTASMAWTIVSGAPAKIKFTSTSLVLYDTQKFVATFYVNLASYDVMQSKLTALNRIDAICNCGGPYCSLEPLYVVNSLGVATLTDYKCTYPQPPTLPEPVQQFVQLSSKTVPHRYYDIQGVYQSEVSYSTPAQEGTEFKYTNDDLLKPNNISTPVGFNEIYGSLNTKATSGKGAQKVNVTLGKSYDIFVDSGTFSTCPSCGNDYFSNLSKIFPVNFATKGGGYTPDFNTTDRFKTSPYRSDEIIFGRACFLPATMIPWSHAKTTGRQSQRLARLAAQHFYFANGYQRDWFGFDYGSVIGSFDGVHWFAVGNGRRIKAKSNRLYLAINAYYGDLTVDNNYTVVVSDASTAPSSGASSTTDYSNDGAQCQKFHACENDTDCVTRLGWEYVCGSVSNLKTKWPLFDINSLEMVNTENADQYLTQFGGGGTSGVPKRCVYRGRGAPCVPDMNSSSTSFNGSVNSTGREARALNSCAPNYYCQGIQVDNTKFNNRIVRYGKSVSAQNSGVAGGISNADLVGRGSPLLGRPFSYVGEATLMSGVLANLNNNSVTGICLPGKNPTYATPTINDLHQQVPASTYYGDRMGGIGITYPDSATKSYMTCPVLDPNTKDYLHLGEHAYNIDSSGTTYPFRLLAGTQNLSTNLIAILEEADFIQNDDLLIENFDTATVTSVAYENNRCLRAPGAVCHSDFDCAPSKFISDKMSGVDSKDSSLYTLLNRYEIDFWKQELICHQDKAKTDPTYDLKNNRCCRANGKDLSIGTYFTHTGTHPNSFEFPSFDNNDVPNLGIVTAGSALRSSQNSTLYYELALGSSSINNGKTYAPLSANANDSCSGACGAAPFLISNNIQSQTNTLHDMGTRTCCSGNWIRHFHDDNGAGHTWDSDKLQKINFQKFQCKNWDVCVADITDAVVNQCSESDPTKGDSIGKFSCAHAEKPQDFNCKIRNIPMSEGRAIMSYLRRFDLLGIPQIHIQKNLYNENILDNKLSDTGSHFRCIVDPDNQAATLAATSTKQLLNNMLFSNDYTLDTEEYQYPDFAAATKYFLSSTDKDNFHTDNIKQIFSGDKFSCCKPAGEMLAAGEPASTCCTGYADVNNRCVLRANYTNVSVYYNRLVSSGAKNLDASFFDTHTGSIKDPNIVAQLACAQKACEGGNLVKGVAFSMLKVPGHETSASNYRTRRFIDGNSVNKHGGLTDLFDAGLKWNDDYYCVPPFDAIASNEAVKMNISLIKCP